MVSFEQQRARMVQQQIASRGVRDERVLTAFAAVPREQFVAGRLHEFAYEDAPLPIEAGQTIEQPYLVAVMLEAAMINPTDRVLEVGAGSGYVAALLSRIAADVFAVEWHRELADLALERMRRLAYRNVRVRQGDGLIGWSEHAPFDAIVVSSGGSDVPQALLEQLVIGGRLVMAIGDEPRTQDVIRVTRAGPHRYERESLGRVQFVPLVGTEGWSADGVPVAPRRARRPVRVGTAVLEHLSALIAEQCEPLDDLEHSPLDGLLERIGSSRVVLIGEATHGTSEFYRFRARITSELIAKRGFTVVAIEADWPDAAVIDARVRGRRRPAPPRAPFARFPTWMWLNHETRQFMDWLAAHNRALEDEARQVSVHGLDLYSLGHSIAAVLDYLDQVDPEAAAIARVRYGCFSPWEMDPATYGRAATSGRMRGCEQQAVQMLADLLSKRLAYLASDGDAFFDAQRNATVVREAERYYRTMYYGARESWNVRDTHMFHTLQAVLRHRGDDARAVVWAHNSHVGNAAATEMGMRGEVNIGQLVRRHFGAEAYLIGFGTDHGTVAAASNWDEPMQVMTIRPAHQDSYERLCHESRAPGFLLHLRGPANPSLRDELLSPRLERAIGVIYRPHTEMLSHYFQAALPAQFDEYVWFDETTAVQPLRTRELAGAPELYPFAV